MGKSVEEAKNKVRCGGEYFSMAHHKTTIPLPAPYFRPDTFKEEHIRIAQCRLNRVLDCGKVRTE